MNTINVKPQQELNPSTSRVLGDDPIIQNSVIPGTVIDPKAFENTDKIINNQILNPPNNFESTIKLGKIPQMSSESKRIRVQLTWKNIYVWPKPDIVCRDCRKVESLFDENNKIILKDINGTVKPGQFLSIIGSTGAGKTTLLQLLAGKMFPHNLAWKGSIEINGESRESVDYSRFTAFVQQDDILMENFSVKECLQFAANVKSSGSLKVREERVRELLKEMELTESQNIRFGSKVLRKGEKKRTSIAVELITNPSLLYVDEPTTGMDTFTAGKLVELMGKLAKRGRTIIATIHQPNSEIFAMFDQLMILSLGRIIYFNSANMAVEYFDKLGYVCPKQTNPAEHFMKILSAENFMKSEDEGDILRIAKERYEKAVIKMSEYYESPENTFKCQVDSLSPQAIHLSQCNLSDMKYVAPWCLQFKYLLKRAFINTIRSPETTVIRLVTTFVVVLLGTALYYNQTYEGYSAMQGRIGFQFYLLVFCLLESIQNVVLIFPEEREAFLREQASTLYDVSAYFMGKIIAEFPFNFVVPLLTILSCFWLWNMNDNHSYNFWINLLNFELMYFAGTGFGLILSAIISDRGILISLVVIVMLPLLFISGFFANIEPSHHILWLFQYISPCKYSFAAGMRNEFEDSDFRIQVEPVPGYVVTADGEYVLSTFKLDPYSWWENYLALAFIIAGTHAIAFVLLTIFGKRI